MKKSPAAVRYDLSPSPGSKGSSKMPVLKNSAASPLNKKYPVWDAEKKKLTDEDI